VVGIEGVENQVTPQLSDDELSGLRASADTLRQSRDGLDVSA
jgi:hypothetical protein